MIDYHVHTSLCNHAKGVMSDFVLSAIAMGLNEICFLDHLTLQDQGKGLSMTPEEVPMYFQAVQALKKKFAGQIHVKAGLEIDFSETHAHMAADIVGRFAFDVIGSSVHFPEGVDIVRSRSEWKNKENISDEQTNSVFAQYYEALNRMLDHEYFDIICHFDLVKKFGRTPTRSFDEKIYEILKKTKNREMTMELNTSGYDHPVNEAYPSPGIINKCKEFGISFAISSDAHDPDSVGRYFDKAFQLLQRAGYTELAVFNRRKRKMVSMDDFKPVPESRV